MQDRRAVLVRLSETDAQVLRPAAEASGLPLDAFLVAATLRFIAVDTEFRRQFNTAGQVSWGAPPPRFAAVELFEIHLSEDQCSAIEKAAAGARYKRSGESLDVTLAQFMLGAALRLLQRRGREKLATLKADLDPFLGPKVPPASFLVAPTFEQNEIASPSNDRKRPASQEGGPSPTVIVSSSVPRLPRVPTPKPQASKTPPSSTKEARASAAASILKRRDGAVLRDRRPVEAPIEDEADDEEGLEQSTSAPPDDGPSSSAIQLRLGLGIGAVTLLAVIVTAIVVVPRRAHPSLTPEEPAALDPFTDEPTQLPGSLSHRKAPSKTDTDPELDRPTLPPPPDDSPSNDPEMAAAAKALKALTKEFHNKGTPSDDIDELLHTVYGRPRVGADGKIVQSDKLDPEHRYDLFIQRATDSVAKVYPVPPALVKAIIKRESNFKADAKSAVGAVGLMQVMPFNATKVTLTVNDLNDPEKNILAGTRLLAVLLKYYDGDITNALVAYNAKARPLFAPIPQNGETPGYVAAVLEYLKEFSDSSALQAPH